MIGILYSLSSALPLMNVIAKCSNVIDCMCYSNVILILVGCLGKVSYLERRLLNIEIGPFLP